MPTNFPTSLDTLTNPQATDPVTNPSHSAQHANANDAIEALQTKVGIDGSAVTTTHDYKLSEITGTDKAVGKTATQTLTNKTLTSPVLNGTISGTAVVPIAQGGTGQTTQTAAMDALSPTTTKGDILVDNGTNVIRLAVGTNNQVLTADSAVAAGVRWSDAGGGNTITTEFSTGTTHSLTTATGEKVLVTAKGNVNNTSSGVSVLLNYNGVQKDIVTAREVGNNGSELPFCLTYTETPGSATANITVTSGGTLSNVVIMVTKIS